MKNLKIYNIKKLRNITLSTLLSATIVTTLSGCGNNSNLIKEYETTISQLQDENSDLHKKINEYEKNFNINQNEPENGENINLINEDGVLNCDSVSKPFYMEYYRDCYGGPDDNGYVMEIIKNGKKYLVDADDVTKVLIKDYESIGEPFFMQYYRDCYGGPDDNGYVMEIIKNGKKTLVDANDFTKVLIKDYESIDEPFFMQYYRDCYGGPDDNGYVMEIIKNGIKYLVDANDFTQILASNYKNVSNENAHIIIEYENGTKNVISNKDFSPTKSLILKQ